LVLRQEFTRCSRGRGGPGEPRAVLSNQDEVTLSLTGAEHTALERSAATLCEAASRVLAVRP
jgi:hypothetical protein